MTEMIIGGAAFDVSVEGKDGAPVLVLAHSLGTNQHLFDRLMPELLRYFRVVRYDARGQGASRVSPGPYSIAQLGQDALAILDALQLEKVDWLGVSQGGCVGLWLLAHAPERIGRAVLANVGAQIGSSEMWNERIRNVQQKGLDSVAPTVLESWFTKSFREQHPEEVEHFWEMLLKTPAEGYAGVCAALRDMDLREAMRSITNPVLVIVGRHDPITPPGVGALVASAISSAKLVTLETAHLSCVEDPAGFSHAAVEFLAAEERAMAEETPQEVIEEVSHMPPPMKKPRKPRAPRKPSAPVDVERIDVAATPMPNGEADPEPEMESEPAPMEAAAMSVPLAPRRKPRHRRPAAVPPAAVAAPAPAPAITITAPQPRKRPAKRAAAKKAAVKRAPVKKAAVKKTAQKKSSARKVVGKKAPVKKAAVTRAAVKKAAMRKARVVPSARRPVAKKAVAKKTTARSVAAKRMATKRMATKKVVAKKMVAKKAVAKKAVAKKAVAKKAPMRKSAAKKVAVRKAVVKKIQAKKASVKKAAAKKTGARKALPRRMPGRRPAARKR
ncbi:MAG: 3-oxoadipate enol-lactonase [Methylovirgula sp.]